MPWILVAGRRHSANPRVICFDALEATRSDGADFRTIPHPSWLIPLSPSTLRRWHCHLIRSGQATRTAGSRLNRMAGPQLDYRGIGTRGCVPDDEPERSRSGAPGPELFAIRSSRCRRPSGWLSKRINGNRRSKTHRFTSLSSRFASRKGSPRSAAC